MHSPFRVTKYLRSRRRRLQRSRRLATESLESRNLLAASVTNFGLALDSGVSATDLLTNDPEVSGVVSWTSSATNRVVVEFDHDGDGQAEGTVAVDTSGDGFNYNPIAHDQALENWEGELTLSYRPVAELPGGSVAGSWEDFKFTLDRVAPAAVSFTPTD